MKQEADYTRNKNKHTPNDAKNINDINNRSIGDMIMPINSNKMN